MSVVCPHCEREIDVPEIVELDEDQTPPRDPLFSRTVYEYIQVAIEAGWRKVKV